MKIYNAYYYEYIPGHGDSQRNHIASYSSFEIACDKVREWIRKNILCDELHLDLDDGLSDEEIEAAYNKAYAEIDEYLAENRKEYDLDKWTQHSECDGIESVEIIEEEID